MRRLLHLSDTLLTLSSLSLSSLFEYPKKTLLWSPFIHTEMSCEEQGNCLSWAARDPSGVLSPHKFNRRFLSFPKSISSFLYTLNIASSIKIISLFQINTIHLNLLVYLVIDSNNQNTIFIANFLYLFLDSYLFEFLICLSCLMAKFCQGCWNGWCFTQYNTLWSLLCWCSLEQE